MSMIEPTNRMVQLIYERIDFSSGQDAEKGIAEGLAEVFDLIEETYKVSEYCGDRLMTGVTCRLTEDEPHRKHRASVDGTRVEWV